MYGRKITEIQKKKLDIPIKVYDIEVEEAHHYILANGVVSHNSYVPMKKMNGGAGLEYAASTIIFLSKKKAKYAKDDTEGYGAIITCTLKKARKTIENKKVETLLNYRTGLDPYFGLLDLSLKFGIVEKMAQGYKFPGEIKAASKALLLTPEKFFTKEVLDLIDEKCKDEFLYGKTNVTLVEETE